MLRELSRESGFKRKSEQDRRDPRKARKAAARGIWIKGRRGALRRNAELPEVLAGILPSRCEEAGDRAAAASAGSQGGSLMKEQFSPESKWRWEALNLDSAERLGERLCRTQGSQRLCFRGRRGPRR